MLSATKLYNLSLEINSAIDKYGEAEVSELLIEDIFRDSTRGHNWLGDAIADFTGMPTVTQNLESFCRANRLNKQYLPQSGTYLLMRTEQAHAV